MFLLSFLLQFCSAERGSGVESCGIPSYSSSSTRILIKGGTVVNAHHQQLADVYVEDGIIVAVQPNIKVLTNSLLILYPFLFLICLKILLSLCIIRLGTKLLYSMLLGSLLCQVKINS